MTDDKKLMQQALWTLEDIFGKNKVDVGIITALRERLAQPERVNQCGETCERAKLCATCARGLDEQPEQWEQFYPDMGKPDAIVQGMPAYEGPLSKAQRTHWEGCEEVHPECRKQEPVVWMNPSWADPDTRGWPSESFESIPIDGWMPLYTAPQRREWQGLTPDEKKGLNDALNLQGRFPVIDAIEAKLREKNV